MRMKHQHEGMDFIGDLTSAHDDECTVRSDDKTHTHKIQPAVFNNTLALANLIALYTIVFTPSRSLADAVHISTPENMQTLPICEVASIDIETTQYKPLDIQHGRCCFTTNVYY